METPQITQLSQNEETRNPAASFPESPINFAGMYTYQRELDGESAEVGPTDLENQMEQAKFAAGHLTDVEIAINSLLLRRKQQDEGVEIANEIKRAECIIPLSCRRQFFDQSP